MVNVGHPYAGLLVPQWPQPMAKVNIKSKQPQSLFGFMSSLSAVMRTCLLMDVLFRQNMRGHFALLSTHFVQFREFGFVKREEKIMLTDFCGPSILCVCFFAGKKIKCFTDHSIPAHLVHFVYIFFWGG